jgi:hypothetical protein
MHQQKAVWQRYFRQATGGSDPLSIQSFLVEQSDLFDVYSDPERKSLRDTFLAEQRRVYTQFQAFRPTDPGQDLGELPDRPPSREEFLALQEELYQQYPGQRPSLRPTDPGPDLGELPDRPPPREEFQALQEELYQLYPSERPRLLAREKRLSDSSRSSGEKRETPQGPIDPWVYREPQRKY